MVLAARLLIQVCAGRAGSLEPFIYLPASRGGEVLEGLVVCSARDRAGDPRPLCAAAPAGGGGGQEVFGGTTKRTFAQRRSPPRLRAGVRVGFFPRP